MVNSFSGPPAHRYSQGIGGWNAHAAPAGVGASKGVRGQSSNSPLPCPAGWRRILCLAPRHAPVNAGPPPVAPSRSRLVGDRHTGGTPVPPNARATKAPVPPAGSRAHRCPVVQPLPHGLGSLEAGNRCLTVALWFERAALRRLTGNGPSPCMPRGCDIPRQRLSQTRRPASPPGLSRCRRPARRRCGCPRRAGRRRAGRAPSSPSRA